MAGMTRIKFSVVKEVYGQWRIHETSEMFEEVVEAASELSGNFWIVTQEQGLRMTTKPKSPHIEDLRFRVDVPPAVAFAIDGKAFFPRGKKAALYIHLLAAKIYNEKHLPVWGIVEAGTAYAYAWLELVQYSYTKGVDLLDDYKKISRGVKGKVTLNLS